MEPHQISINLESLHLNNFRGFKDIELSFDKHLTVLIGENGAGKTSLLDALAALLSYPISRLVPKLPFDNKVFDKYDIHNDVSTIKRSSDVEDWWSKNTINLLINEDAISYQLRFSEVELANIALDLDTDAKLQVELDWTKIMQGWPEISLPILAYYSLSHIYPTNGEELERIDTGVFSTYENALNHNAINFNEFKKWLEWQQNIEKEDGHNPVLEQVRKAIIGILNEETNTYQNPRISWKNRDSSIGQFAVDKGNQTIYGRQLSSGERTLIALVGDLARRLTLANPSSSNPLHGKGIALIDEIDLHLHPKWQRKVVGKLRKLFPNV